MIRTDPSKAAEPGNFLQTSAAPGLSVRKDFVLSMVDELLRPTLQYSKWQEIRAGDPARAHNIAKQVLDRHSYVVGKAPATAEGKKRFDEITAKLSRAGIYLYKAHQFKKPIFPSTITGKPGEAEKAESGINSGGSTISPQTLALRDRFSNKDCLEFLAGILEENGIDYYGKKGVARALMLKARTQRMNLNSYLTGEGITKLLCQQPVTVRVPEAGEHLAEEVWARIEPHLKRGAILSYSSEHFGHTGVVEQVNGRWVYINSSGSFGDRQSYRVLEEDLKSEMKHWLRRSQENGTFLQITMGSVDQKLALDFSNSSKSSPRVRQPLINLLT